MLYRYGLTDPFKVFHPISLVTQGAEFTSPAIVRLLGDMLVRQWHDTE
jgi:hypothetical protein